MVVYVKIIRTIAISTAQAFFGAQRLPKMDATVLQILKKNFSLIAALELPYAQYFSPVYGLQLASLFHLELGARQHVTAHKSSLFSVSSGILS